MARRDRQSEVDAEIEAHIRMSAEDRIARGVPRGEAYRQARLDIGSVRATREEARAVWSFTAIEQLWMDLRAGLRILTHAPGLSLTAIALIALVIGGNTTIYSAVHGMLTKPAPGISPHNRVAIAWTYEDGRRTPETSFLLARAVIGHTRTMRAAAFANELITMTLESGSYSVRGVAITAGYFDALGVPLLRGRAFDTAESGLDAGGLVAVISERLWRQHFGGTDAAIGAAIQINSHPATVIGVTAAPFQGAWTADAADLWVPAAAFARVRGREQALNDPRERSVEGMVAELMPNATAAHARAELETIRQRFAEEHPRASGPVAADAVEYTGIAGRDNMIATQGPRFLAIFSIVTLVTVLIVCANVANLMLARAVSRQREMAVRQSFGASRWRITRIVLAEGLVLSLTAWAVACVFAYWMCHVLRGIIPPSETGGVEVLLDFTPDWNVLGYALLLAIVATITFTIAPAVRTWKQDLLSFLKSGERGIVQGRSRATRSLVALQLAFSVVLLTSAGLAYRSLSLMRSAELGFNTSDVLLLTLDTRASAPTADTRAALVRRMTEQLRSVRGVDQVAESRNTPAAWWGTRTIRTSQTAQPVVAEYNEVGPDYFRTLGLAPLAGSEFTDRAAQAPAEAMINKHLADALWPGESAVGRTILVGGDVPFTVTAVVPNALVGGYRRDARPPMVFLPSQHTRRDEGVTTFYVRYRGALESLVPAVSRALRATAPASPLLLVRTFESELASMTWLYRTLTLLLMVFAGGSLLIATAGQYAAMTFAMRQRVRDFAIRMAMGASSRQVLTSALYEGLFLTAAGLAIGLLLGSLAGHAARGLLHGITPTDTVTYAAVLSVLGIASLGACFVPALRSSRVNPIDALRVE